MKQVLRLCQPQAFFISCSAFMFGYANAAVCEQETMTQAILQEMQEIPSNVYMMQ